MKPSAVSMQTPQQASEVQRALDAALYTPIPQPVVIEDNSDEAWLAWDAAVAKQQEQQQ